jgi:hypothetical protein
VAGIEVPRSGKSTTTMRRRPSLAVSIVTTPTCVNNPGDKSVNKL